MTNATPQVTERLRRIQKTLGVHPDGLLGPETLTAIERKLSIDAPRKSASLSCSCRSLEDIVRFEVGSRAQYERRYAHPTWPGGESGVTIGLGYDLGFTSKAQIEADFGPFLEQPARASLAAVQGIKGAAAEALARGIRHVNIPLAAFSSAAQFRAAVTAHWLPALERFRPQMIFISAGFDAHRDDEMAMLCLVEADYAWVTQQLMAIAARHAQGRIVSMLEGGYELHALGRSVAAHVKVLADL